MQQRPSSGANTLIAVINHDYYLTHKLLHITEQSLSTSSKLANTDLTMIHKLVGVLFTINKQIPQWTTEMTSGVVMVSNYSLSSGHEELNIVSNFAKKCNTIVSCIQSHIIFPWFHIASVVLTQLFLLQHLIKTAAARCGFLCIRSPFWPHLFIFVLAFN